MNIYRRLGGEPNDEATGTIHGYVNNYVNDYFSRAIFWR